MVLQKRILAIILWGLVGLAIAALGLVWAVLQVTGGLLAGEAVYTLVCGKVRLGQEIRRLSRHPGWRALPTPKRPAAASLTLL